MKRILLSFTALSMTCIAIALWLTNPTFGRANNSNSQLENGFKNSAKVNSVESYPRRMVVEEGTGTWCGWCVRGIVGMESMKEKYPDNFIGIAIHNGDPMEYSESYGLNFTGYPSAYFNRRYTGDPNTQNIEYYLKYKSGLTTNAMVKIMSATYNNDYTRMSITTNVRFGFDATETDYRLAYVLTENNVGPYMQRNFYAGGKNGEMGGYENMSNSVEVIFNDVARGIYPSNTGVEGSVPSSIEACTDYSYDYTITMPKNIDSYDNLELTVLLYDAKTSEIVNADRIVCPQGIKPANEITIDTGDEPGTLEAKLGDQIYEVSSLIVKGKINGLDLATLRHMMGCGETNWSTGNNTQLKCLDLQDAQIVKGGLYAYKGNNSNDFYLNEDNILPEYVFCYNLSLRKLITPKSLKKIEKAALENSGSLTEVILHEGLEEIGEDAFSTNMLSANIKILHIPSTVRRLDPTFIKRCVQLEDFSISLNNPYYLFDGKAIYTTGKKQFVCAFPPYVGVIMLEDDCKSIGYQALYFNYNVKGLVGKNVKEIGWSAFWASSSMEYLALGTQLSYINSSFDYCHALKDIYLGCFEVPTGNYIYTAEWDEIGEATLYVPQSAIEKFRKSSFWSKLKEIKPLEGTEFEYLKEGYQMEVFMPPSGYATFFDSEHAYALPDGLSAQVVTDVSNSKLIYKVIALGSAGGVVPKGTAVMLVNDAKCSGTYTLTAKENSASYSGTNLLHGSDGSTTTAGVGYHYKLSYGLGTKWSSVFGWYWGAQNGAPFVIEGHKAWLVVPADAVTRASGYMIEGDATEMLIDIESGNEANDIYYDMQGRSIGVPTSSGVYIKDGKKVIIK